MSLQGLPHACGIIVFEAHCGTAELGSFIGGLGDSPVDINKAKYLQETKPLFWDAACGHVQHSLGSS